MARNDIEFRVGLVILIGLLMLAGSLYWLQGYKLERNAQLIRVRFHDVGTLAIGDRVTVSGVHRGKVNALELTANGVEVDLLLYRDVVLKADAGIVIKNLGLMGERFIAISPGTDTALFDPSVIAEGVYDAGLPEVMGLMGDMIVELRNLVHSVKKTVGSDSSLNQFKETAANLERVSRSLADYVDRSESRMDKTVENFHQASARLNQMLSDNAPRVDSSLSRVERASVDLDLFAARLDTFSIQARAFAETLNNPDGSLYLMINDRRLYDDLRRSADNFDDLVTDIRANPRKYINLKVELF